MPRSRAVLLALLVLPLALGGCRNAAAWFAMPFLYEEASLPDEQVVRDVPYRDDPAAHPEKHRLDLFLPAGEGPWPVLVFVHGGGWTRGDRAERFGGRDIYGNIGRFFAGHGIGVAVLSYRLQFDVTWKDQADDVARALAWVSRHIGGYGGDPEALFVSGHSAGAQLAVRVAFDPAMNDAAVCGLIPVSGAAYDLTDAYADGPYYERRFRAGDEGDGWKREGSTLPLVQPGLPPVLVVYAKDEWIGLHRQAELLHEALREAGVASELFQIPDENHYTEVLGLSMPGHVASDRILAFIRERAASC